MRTSPARSAPELPARSASARLPRFAPTRIGTPSQRAGRAGRPRPAPPRRPARPRTGGAPARAITVGAGSTCSSPVVPSRASVVPSATSSTPGPGRDDGRDAAGPGQDRAVRGRAAAGQHDAEHPLRVERRRLRPGSGRRRPGSRGSLRSGRAARTEQLAGDRVAHRADVGGAGPQVRVGQRLELGGHLVGGLEPGPGRAGAGVDPPVGLGQQLGIVEQQQVRLEDRGLRRRRPRGGSGRGCGRCRRGRPPGRPRSADRASAGSPGDLGSRGRSGSSARTTGRADRQAGRGGERPAGRGVPPRRRPAAGPASVPRRLAGRADPDRPARRTGGRRAPADRRRPARRPVRSPARHPVPAQRAERRPPGTGWPPAPMPTRW